MKYKVSVHVPAAYARPTTLAPKRFNRRVAKVRLTFVSAPYMRIITTSLPYFQFLDPCSSTGAVEHEFPLP